MLYRFWLTLYTAFIITPMLLLAKAASLFSGKIKRGLDGRRRLFEELILNMNSLDPSKKLVWVHSSSLGEFEQAKPIIEKLKSLHDLNILVTFFSPSGYDNSIKYQYADVISYIPIDTQLNARRFIRSVHPDLVIIMRYDIWPNHLWMMHQMNIPVFLVDATMRSNSPRMKPLSRSFHRTLYSQVERILTVSVEDKDNFRTFGCGGEQLRVMGDTRYDRVYDKSGKAKDKQLIPPSILEGKKVFVAGSIWPEDEEVILPAVKKLLRFDSSALVILVPHEPQIMHLEKIEQELRGCGPSLRFSHLNNYAGERIIIVDSIGILLTLYYYADCAFVGGSFKSNVHNVLEAAVYGIPVMYGPKIHNSREAADLAAAGGGIIVGNKVDAYRQLRRLYIDDAHRAKKGKAASDYVQENLGATAIVVDEITRRLFGRKSLQPH